MIETAQISSSAARRHALGGLRFTLALAVIVAGVFGSGCSKSGSTSCTEDVAYNKMLALQKVQARLVAKGADSGNELAQRLMIDSAPLAEMIAKKQFAEACAKADEIGKKLGADLKKEEKGMVTIQQLRADGGKGDGICSVADVAKRQMEVHGKIQAAIDAGKLPPNMFRTFGDDTKALGEMMSTNPSEGCKLLDGLERKYKLD